MKNVPTSLNILKNKVDKLNVDKLIPVPVNLSKLSDVVKNDVFKKDGYNAKIKHIEDKIHDITNLATNTTLNAKINEVKNKIPSITNLATNSSLNSKINGKKSEIPNIANLAATAALTSVENKIPNVGDLVKKADYDAKISEMEKKYFNNTDYNKFISNTLDAKIAQKKLDLVNGPGLNEKIKEEVKKLATKAE